MKGRRAAELARGDFHGYIARSFKVMTSELLQLTSHSPDVASQAMALDDWKLGRSETTASLSAKLSFALVFPYKCAAAAHPNEDQARQHFEEAM